MNEKCGYVLAQKGKGKQYGNDQHYCFWVTEI